MISPSHICFKGLAALLVFAGAAAVAATVSGNVSLTGSHVASVNKRKNYAGVVVWLEPASGAQPVQPRHAEMVQKDKSFHPHVLPITVGSSVNFPNYDPIFHNAFSNYSGQLFDVGLYPPGTSRTVVFKREGVVRVFCNIHPTMSAVILVLRSSNYTVTKSDGSWSIANVPPGEYTLHFFHERATDATLNALSKKIVVDRDVVTAANTEISETGFVQTPHKNKFGKDYPPVIDDFSTYPGANK